MINRLLQLSALLLPLALMTGCDQTQTDANVTQWPMTENCDLHQGSCRAEFEGQSLTLKISPSPIPVARPLGVEVVLEGINPSSVQMDISGINMYMGYNRVNLTSTKPDHWVGTSMLAFCTAETMQWQITLMLEQNGQQIQIPFPLETRNRTP